MQKLLLSIITTFLFSHVSSAEPTVTTVGVNCVGPVKTVYVVVKSVKNELVTDYNISVTNNDAYPIRDFRFGSGKAIGFISFEDIQITGTPENWKSRAGNHHESVYQSIAWWAVYDKKTKKVFNLQPGETLHGLSVRTVVPRKEYLSGTTVNGIRTGPLDLTKMPFSVILDTPTTVFNCLWGFPVKGKG